jgi:hypothetical protein
MNDAQAFEATSASGGAVTPAGEPPAGRGRAAEFNALYNELDAHLRRELGIERRYDFMDLVNEGVHRGLVHPSHVNELRDCKALRNLIVHTSRQQHEALAEPSAWGMTRFRQIVEAIVRPERVFPTFRRRVAVHDPRDPLTSALRHMAEHDYSQVTVRVQGHLTLLSSEGITHWLAAHTSDGAPAIAGTSIGDVLAHEPEGTCAFLARHATVEQARDLFEHAPGLPQPRVQAVIITEHGSATEEPLGFATPWDLVADDD